MKSISPARSQSHTPTEVVVIRWIAATLVLVALTWVVALIAFAVDLLHAEGVKWRELGAFYAFAGANLGLVLATLIGGLALRVRPRRGAAPRTLAGVEVLSAVVVFQLFVGSLSADPLLARLAITGLAMQFVGGVVTAVLCATPRVRAWSSCDEPHTEPSVI